MTTEDQQILYVLGVYPRATDTFIQREIAELRRVGLRIATVSIRRPVVSELVGPEQRDEVATTHYLLPCPLVRLLRRHLAVFIKHPLRYLRAAYDALHIRSPGIRSLLYQMYYLAEAGLVAHYAIRSRCHHAHNHSPDAAGTVTTLACQMAGMSYSMTLHGPGIFYEPFRWQLPQKLSRASFVACISHFARSQAMSWLPRGQWERLKIIHCGIDLKRYGPVAKDTRRPRHIAFVGRLEPVKGVAILLEAFALTVREFPSSKLELVGDGSIRAELKQLAGELGIEESVNFRGYRSQSEVCRLLEMTDVLVLPSFAEGVPVVLMEAMASGVPVIATNVGGVSELVKDGVNGYVIPPGDVASLVARLGNLLNDEALRFEMGCAGRKTVEREFDLRAETERLEKTFRAVIISRVQVMPQSSSPPSRTSDLERACRC